MQFIFQFIMNLASKGRVFRNQLFRFLYRDIYYGRDECYCRRYGGTLACFLYVRSPYRYSYCSSSFFPTSLLFLSKWSSPSLILHSPPGSHLSLNLGSHLSPSLGSLLSHKQGSHFSPSLGSLNLHSPLGSHLSLPGSHLSPLGQKQGSHLSPNLGSFHSPRTKQGSLHSLLGSSPSTQGSLCFPSGVSC